MAAGESKGLGSCAASVVTMTGKRKETGDGSKMRVVKRKIQSHALNGTVRLDRCLPASASFCQLPDLRQDGIGGAPAGRSKRGRLDKANSQQPFYRRGVVRSIRRAPGFWREARGERIRNSKAYKTYSRSSRKRRKKVRHGGRWPGYQKG